jgi:hypothetical protein
VAQPRLPDPAWAACRQAIAAEEPRSGLPPGLLLAVALIETGRSAPGSGRMEPWPWSYNADGEGHIAATKADAVAEVSVLRAQGIASIDIGCMQINLKHHPAAFADLEHGFDAAENVRYAAGFLRDLRARAGNWSEAIALSHSGDPGRGAMYQRRVMLARLGAGLGRGGVVQLPTGVASGLCAAGMAPVLVLRGARPRMMCRR